MRTQRGVGLVEVMVALTIGLFLLLGLGTVFFSMNQTFTLRQQLSATQDNQRMAMTILKTSVHNAGYYPTPQLTAVVTFFPTLFAQFPASGSFAAGQVLSGTTGASYTDTLSVRFAAGPTFNQGCSDSLVAGDLYTDVFSAAGGFLTCVETDNTSSVTTTVNLIAGVTGMAVLYGVDTTGSGSVTQYLTATQVTTAAQWTSVKTLKLTLQFANPLQGQIGQNASIYLTQTIPYMIGL